MELPAARSNSQAGTLDLRLNATVEDGDQVTNMFALALRRAANPLKFLVLALVATTSLTSSPVQSASTKTLMPRWFSCGGVAPEVSECEIKFKMHKDFRLANLRGGGTDIYPGSSFSGRIEAVWDSASTVWTASRLVTNGSAAPMPFEHVIWGRKDQALPMEAWTDDRAPEEVITMKGRATGTGPWAVKARIEYLGPQPLPVYRWYACRGHAPEVTTCNVRFKAGRSLMIGTGRGGGSQTLVHALTAGFRGRMQAEWVSPSTRWWMDCTYNLPVDGLVKCEGLIGRKPKPGETMTMNATITGIGSWTVVSRVTIRPCGRCDG